MINAGLVLEGGGMRGLYTAGVLEYFMEQDLYFPYIIGVSAGACMGASYLSRQKGRNKKVNLGYIDDKRYISFSNYIRKREIFGMDFIFDEIPNKLVPFDMEAFRESPEEFVIVTTDCETGEPVYFDKSQQGDDLVKLLRASSSLPFVSSSVEYKGKHLLDGGIVDPIPVKKAEGDGYQKNVVILTKPEGYFKRPSKLSSVLKYKRHPKISELLRERYKHYNATVEYINEQEKAGNVFVLRPSVSLPVGRMERNRERLEELYELGQNDAREQFAALKDFLG
ncbi:patatin family protein [Oceanobacillus luteolus]|uniref:patatin-like phospholipase family protein n=1 Tax=Oceanobacillus luteolus TaxID=1274358 RepID=UPI00203B217F|nr:patatin family protein [Oceanobacillus luteolus]MCM3741351.1 patatin family protein [Oceanobacillus luteolus]